MKDLYTTIQTLRAELAKLNLDCNVIEVGFGNNYLRFTFIWETGSGPKSAISKVRWDALDMATTPETMLATLLENFRKHQLDTIG